MKAAFIALAATLAAAPGALAQDTNQHDPGVRVSKPAAGDTTRNHVTLVFNFLGELRRLLQ